MRRLCLTLACLCTTAGLWITSGGSHLALVVGGLTLLAGGAGGRLEIPPRVTLALTLATLLVASLFQPPIPVPNGFLFEPALVYGLGLGTATVSALLLLRRSKDSEENLVLASSVMTLLLAGNTTYPLPYGYTVALFTVFIIGYLRSGTLGLRLSTVVAGAGSLVLAVLIGVVLSWSESGFNNLMNFSALSASVNFGDVAGIKPQSGPGGKKVLLRVLASAPDHYLAARRYENYHRQKWTAAPPQSLEPAVTPLSADRTAYLPRGPVGQDWVAESTDRVELTTLKPEALLAPLSSRIILASVRAAQTNSSGDLLVDPGPEFTGSYSFVRGDLSVAEVPATLSRCLEVEASPEVTQLAREIAGVSEDKLKVFALQRFFQENFEYGFGYPFDQAEDPVATFLKERPPAHCEVFATSMALMCRAVGVPSRYVQGFLVRERNDLGGYWVSRERDAHAWVEVYLQDEGWVVVDPTPPGVSGPVEEGSTWSDLTDVARRHFQRLWSLLLRGPSAILDALANGLSEHGMAIALFVLGLGGWRLRHLFRSRVSRHTPDPPLDPGVVRMQSLLSRFESLIGEEKPAHLTLLEWAREKPVGAEFLPLYSQVRYGQSQPNEEQLAALEAAVERVVAAVGPRPAQQ